MEKGTLYLIPCPIGDTPPYDVLPERNREIIGTIDYFIVENIRSARRFLSKAGIGRPIDSLEFVELNEHTPSEAVETLLAPLLAGRDAGIISEAGLPGIADPGADAVRIAHRHGIRVKPLVGPSSLLLALMASGLNGQSFAFNGYLPIKGPERDRAIAMYEKGAVTDRQSQLFIEAPYRNSALFTRLIEVCAAETRLSIAVDLTTPQEWIKTLSIGEWRKKPAPDLNKRPAIFILG